MAQKKNSSHQPSKWPLRIAAAGLFLAEIVVLPGAASPFRVPKDSVILAALCLVIGFATVAAARRGAVTLPRGPLAVVLLALPLLQATSAVWSPSPLRALESALLSAIWAGGILWFATLGEASRRRLAVVAAAGVVVSSLIMVLQVVGIPVFTFSSAFSAGRLSLTGLTGNPSDLAMAAVLLLPLLFTAYPESTRPRLIAAMILILTTATVLTQSLAGVAALAAVSLVWLVQQRSRKLWAGAAVASAVLLALTFTSGLGTRIVAGVERVERGDWYQLLSARGDGWSAATEMIETRPILGVGAANFSHQYYPSRLAWLDRHERSGGRNELATHFSWAHCDPLQLQAELGIVGTLWLAALLWAIARTRTRAGGILPLAAAALAPFVLFHYPTHLAVGLIPCALMVGALVATDAEPRAVTWHRGRALVAVIVLLTAVVGAGWQLRRVAADLWMGSLEFQLTAADGATPEVRARRAAAIEASVLSRIGRLPLAAPTLWRTVGRARLQRGDIRGAETAFRSAYAGWPHEDAEFYLGLSLFAQGRRTEGLQHLGRVCLTNPALMTLIGDPDLRRLVEDVLAAYSSR
jgi:O-antigen ligase